MRLTIFLRCIPTYKHINIKQTIQDKFTTKFEPICLDKTRKKQAQLDIKYGVGINIAE